MAKSSDKDGVESGSEIMSNLPRSRPQIRTNKRAAGRTSPAADKKPVAKPVTATSAKPAKPKASGPQKRKQAPKTAKKPAQTRKPQPLATESQSKIAQPQATNTGNPVELISAATKAASNLAKVSATAGNELVRSLLGRITRR